uniref:Uncharacterized protein n=1 Tax=Musa acuminata TaxID=4641 RepID=Q1ENV1_MUSAC|nr:hypothetical protein MA4_82I11.30 [Musa acuminata]
MGKHCEIKWGSNLRQHQTKTYLHVEIGLNGELTYGMVSERSTINSMERSQFKLYDTHGRSPMRDLIMQRYDRELLGAPLRGMIGEVGELDCSIAQIRLREPNKSEDKAERTQKSVIVSGRSTDREERDTDGEHLVVKEAEEVENVKTNSKYRDKVEEQRLENFCSTKERRKQYATLYLLYSEE